MPKLVFGIAIMPKNSLFVKGKFLFLIFSFSLKIIYSSFSFFFTFKNVSPKSFLNNFICDLNFKNCFNFI